MRVRRAVTIGLGVRAGFFFHIPARGAEREGTESGKRERRAVLDGVQSGCEGGSAWALVTRSARRGRESRHPLSVQITPPH